MEILERICTVRVPIDGPDKVAVNFIFIGSCMIAAPHRWTDMAVTRAAYYVTNRDLILWVYFNSDPNLRKDFWSEKIWVENKVSSLSQIINYSPVFWEIAGQYNEKIEIKYECKSSV